MTLRRLTASCLALAAVVGCARRPGGPQATAGGVRPSVPSAAATRAIVAAAGRRVAEQYRVAAISRRRFTHAQLWAALTPIVGAPGAGVAGLAAGSAAATAGVRVRDVGRSGEGRAIRAVTVGAGRTTVLLWSQMHGDEPTGTMAVADLLAWFADPRAGADPLRARLTAALTIVAVPMLNPDGAQRFRRENAAGVDVNRDALRRATPEARALALLADSLRPAFGFNLHDHDPRSVNGRGGALVAVSLLAPPAGPDGAWGPTREAARRVAAGLAEVLAEELPGRVARYDDAYTPTAFGEWMQAHGTSTVLVESGTLAGDPEKQRLRALHVTALVAALDAIASGRWREADPRAYDALPGSGRRAARD